MRHEPGSVLAAACLPRAVDGDATLPRHAAPMGAACAVRGGRSATSALLATTAGAWRRQGDRVVTGSAPVSARRLSRETGRGR